jgi:hypothetical protein
LGWVTGQGSSDGDDLSGTSCTQRATSVPAEESVGAGYRDLQSFVALSRTISGKCVNKRVTVATSSRSVL